MRKENSGYEKNAEQKEIERKVAEAQQQVKNSWVESSEVTKDVPAFKPGNCKPGLRQKTLDNKPPNSLGGYFSYVLEPSSCAHFMAAPPCKIARRALISKRAGTDVNDEVTDP